METNMQCPNCSNQIPNTAKKCGVCGASLDALPEPVKAWLPDWAKALLTGMGIGLIIFAFLGTAFYFFYLQPSRSVAPPPTETITMTVEPAQAPPTATVIVIETLPSEMPTLTPTTTPTQTPTPTEETEYCDAFEGIDMTVVYMDWLKGEPLEFYIKMPGGVPGLEKTIPGSPEEWTYRAKIGDYSSSHCDIIAGYRERLYCRLILPKEYESAMQPMSLYVNTCGEDVYKNQHAFLPEIVK